MNNPAATYEDMMGALMQNLEQTNDPYKKMLGQMNFQNLSIMESFCGKKMKTTLFQILRAVIKSYIQPTAKKSQNKLFASLVKCI